MPLASISRYLKFLRGLLLRDRPIYFHYAVTSRCNLRCQSCSIWRRPTDELSIAEVGQLAEVASRLGCVQVSLGGGEPAMRDDLPEIVRAFQSRGINTRVLSNGVALTPAKARRLVDAGLREVSVSLDSLDPETQDSLDNAAGAHKKRLENLLALAELLPRQGSLPLLNTVVTPKNFLQLPQIVRFAADIGFHASLIPVHLAGGSDHRFYSDADELRFDKQQGRQLRQVYDELLEIKRRGGPIINSSVFLQRSPDYLLSGEARWPCRAGELFVSVGPNGKVAACHAFEGTHEVDFVDFERAFHAPGYRAEVRRRARTCEGCFRPCWTEISYLVHDPRSLLEMTRVQLKNRLRRRRVDTGVIRKLLEACKDEGAGEGQGEGKGMGKGEGKGKGKGKGKEKRA